MLWLELMGITVRFPDLSHWKSQVKCQMGCPVATDAGRYVQLIAENPVDAVRTGTLLAIEGTAAFGAASLALLRATRGPAGAGGLVALSVLFWIVVPAAIASRRLGNADL